VGEGCRESLVAVGVSCAIFTDSLHPNCSMYTFSYGNSSAIIGIELRCWIVEYAEFNALKCQLMIGLSICYQQSALIDCALAFSIGVKLGNF
jgi:hypothetical protein